MDEDRNRENEVGPIVCPSPGGGGGVDAYNDN